MRLKQLSFSVPFWLPRGAVGLQIFPFAVDTSFQSCMTIRTHERFGVLFSPYDRLGNVLSGHDPVELVVDNSDQLVRYVIPFRDPKNRR